MIKLDDTYSLDSDRYQWILIKGKKKTYHANLPQVAKYALDNGIKGADSLEKLAARMEELANQILTNVEK